MDFIDVLKKFIDMGFKQSAFEKRCGMSKGKLSEILRGRTMISKDLIDSIIEGIENVQLELDEIIDDLLACKENTENNYLVYELSFPNGKKYYGRTYNVNARWQNGTAYKNQLVGKAIEEFGWENVEKKIVAENLTKANAQMIEHSLIKGTGSDMPQLGYNIF